MTPFMAHGGQKLRFGLRRRFRRATGSLQFGVRAGELIAQPLGGEHGIDPYQKFGGIERFGQKIHGSQAEGLHLFIGGVAAGQQENWHVAILFPRLQVLQNVKSLPVRQPEVEENQVKRAALHFHERRLSIRRTSDLHPSPGGVLQADGDGLLNVRIVIYQQDMGFDIAVVHEVSRKI